MFHASDPVFDRRPWYPSRWRNAGGCDTEFWRKWERAKRVRPPFEVLHLGPDGENWCGRLSRRLDDATIPPDIEQSRRVAMEVAAEMRDRPWSERLVKERLE